MFYLLHWEVSHSVTQMLPHQPFLNEPCDLLLRLPMKPQPSTATAIGVQVQWHLMCSEEREALLRPAVAQAKE